MKRWFGRGLLTRPSSATVGLPVLDRQRVTWRQRLAERRGLETIAEQGATWPWCQKLGPSAPRSAGGERGEKV